MLDTRGGGNSSLKERIAMTEMQKNTQKDAVKAKPTLKYLREKDQEKVRGIFRFHEVQGGTLSFVFKCYKEDPIERFDLKDGSVYTVPLGVAKHLNKNGWYPVHENFFDENNKMGTRIGQKVARFAFQSLEFVDVDDLSPVATSIVTVEKI